METTGEDRAREVVKNIREAAKNFENAYLEESRAMMEQIADSGLSPQLSKRIDIQHPGNIYENTNKVYTLDTHKFMKLGQPSELHPRMYLRDTVKDITVSIEYGKRAGIVMKATLQKFDLSENITLNDVAHKDFEDYYVKNCNNVEILKEGQKFADTLNELSESRVQEAVFETIYADLNHFVDKQTIELQSSIKDMYMSGDKAEDTIYADLNRFVSGEEIADEGDLEPVEELDDEPTERI